MNIPYDMSTAIGKDLREVPINVSEFKQGVNFLKEELQQTSGSKQARIMSKLGVSQRIIGDLASSKETLELAVDLSKESRANFIAKLRLAQTIQFGGDYRQAEVIYQDLILLANSKTELAGLVDFVHQHLGKCFFEQSEFKKALYHFRKALEMRETKGALDLINSTKLAITITEKSLIK